MDDEYAAKSNNLQVKGKSALDFMIKNVQRLEDEIAKAEQVKTNNIIKKIALKQKRYTRSETEICKIQTVISNGKSCSKRQQT